MPGLSGPLTSLSKKIAAPDQYIQKFSTVPTMDEYKVKGEDGKFKTGEYEVELDDKSIAALSKEDKIEAIWKLYHPSGKL
jgi:hypothetical protein